LFMDRQIDRFDLNNLALHTPNIVYDETKSSTILCNRKITFISYASLDTSSLTERNQS
jgi:hypothetical protein